MADTFTTIITHRNREYELEVEFTWCSADPDVGIMSAYAEDIDIVEVTQVDTQESIDPDLFYADLVADQINTIEEAANAAASNLTYEPDIE